MMAPTSPPHWEDIRKQARLLENEIDLKLVSFSKLGTGNRDYSSVNVESVALLSSSNSEHMFETMALEIDQLILKLNDVNDKLTAASMNQATFTPSPATAHMIQRHREILQDYTKEFQKTKGNIQARRDREDLLGSVRKDIDSYKNSSGLNRRTEMFLKENEHLRSSERLVDEQIGIAMKTKDDLLIQRSTMKAIQTQITTLANRFPVISSLIQRINLRKRRDSIIVGAVIGVCLVLILLYAWH